MLRTGIITSYLRVRLLVRSGFINTYPGELPSHGQNLVSGYATNQASGVCWEKYKMRHRGYPCCTRLPSRLFLENHRRSAYPMDLEGNVNFDAVGYLDEWNPAVHAKFLAVKSHGALDVAVACSLFLGVKCQGQRFVLRHTANCELALHIDGSRTGLHNFGGMKRDVRVVFGIEEVFAFQFVVLHAASRVNGVCINFDVDYA